MSNGYTDRFSIVSSMKITFTPEQFGGSRRRSTTRQQELMDISTLVKTLSVFFTACSWAGHDVLSLELSYPPNIVTDENVCLLDWTSSKAVCESKTQPATKHRLFRYDGKKVFLFLISENELYCLLYSFYSS